MRRAGLNAIYLPFRVPRAELADFLKAFDRVPVEGYSVTIPHKEAAAEIAAHMDETVERTRAANTLIKVEDGFNAYNTDYQAVIDSLAAALPQFTSMSSFMRR